jgi:hypothetical protein
VTTPPSSSPTLPRPPDPEAALLARAYALILSWPCPICGKPYPCEHDLATMPAEANSDGA